jgi:hypothetical protein
MVVRRAEAFLSATSEKISATSEKKRHFVFGPTQLVLSEFGYNAGGWRVESHARFLADLTGDGRPDIVGFADEGVRASFNFGNGAFGDQHSVLWGYFGADIRTSAYSAGFGGLYFLTDVTGDGRADIVSFEFNGVVLAINNGDGTFQPPQLIVEDFGFQAGGWLIERHPRFLADLTGDGRADIVGFANGGVVVALNNGDGTFQTPQLVLEDFGYDAGGWRIERHPRLLADLTGDGRADIVGFANGGVVVALNNGDGTFQPPQLVLEDFGYDAGGWRVESHSRFLADLTGGGRADIVGFGNAGVVAALNNGDGTFNVPELVVANFGIEAGWSVDKHPRFLADLTGDGRADILGFGDAGVIVALNSVVSFQEPQLVLSDFGYEAGGWRIDRHPRILADLTGDGRADIVGFGNAGVSTALSNGDGTFQAPHLVLAEFGYDAGGWRVGRHPRFLADLTGDGRADIVGFANTGVMVALNNGDGTFQGAQLVLAEFGYDAGGWRVTRHPRFLADLTGDGRADIVGFANTGVMVALNNGDGTFQGAQQLVLAEFGYDAGGWRVTRHPRFLADLTGDGRADIVGFADNGVLVALNNGDGTFRAPQLVVAEFGYEAGGWRVGRHPRFLADLTGDGRMDIVGFGYDGVLAALNNGDGTFQSPRRVVHEFGYYKGDWRVDRRPRLLADLTGDRCCEIVGFRDDGVRVSLNNGNGTFQAPLLVIHGFGAELWRVDRHPRFLADLTGDGRADIVGFGDEGVWVSLNTS